MGSEKQGKKLGTLSGDLLKISVVNHPEGVQILAIAQDGRSFSWTLDTAPEHLRNCVSNLMGFVSKECEYEQSDPKLKRT